MSTPNHTDSGPNSGAAPVNPAGSVPSAPAPPAAPAGAPLNEAAWFETNFQHSPLMAILRGMGAERSTRLATRAWHLGIDAVEIPLQSTDDEAAFAAVMDLAKARGKLVGAGTIVRAEQVEAARALGASYLVSPGFDPEILAAARTAQLPLLPGVATPSEVQIALAHGLTWLKAFPAHWLTTEWFRHLRGPFPQVQFVATGGMDANNAAEFLARGVRVVAVGSALEDETQLEKLAALMQEVH